MKLLFDFFPILLFFTAYKFGGDIYLATKVTMAATVLQVVISKLVFRKVDAMLRMTAAIVLALGTLTIVLHNPNFIKWKPTVLYWCMALTLLIGQTVFKRNLLRSVMEEQIKLPDVAWLQLNVAWIIFMTVMGCLNLFVAYTYSEATWVNFKFYGITGIMFAFCLGMMLFISRHLPKEEPEKE